MRVESILKCLKCNDEFLAKSEEKTKCSCGACNVEPRKYSVSYSTMDGAGLNFETISTKTFYEESEFFIMTERCQSLWNKILDFKFEDYRYFTYAHQLVEKSDCGRTFVQSISAHFDIKVNMVENNRFDFHQTLRPNIDENILWLRLKRYLNLLIGLKSGKFQGKNVEQMKTAFRDWGKEQVDYYDHTFEV